MRLRRTKGVEHAIVILLGQTRAGVPNRNEHVLRLVVGGFDFQNPRARGRLPRSRTIAVIPPMTSAARAAVSHRSDMRV